MPHSPVLRIIDSDTHRECPADVVGEIWVHGDNVASGYGASPRGTAVLRRADRRTIRRHPGGPWLRTGDLGFVSEGELFIVGRIKDLLIIRGRNYYPEDIEATVQEISRGGSRPSRFRSTAPRSWSPSSSSRSAAIPTSRPSGAKSPRRSRMRTG
ncbi:AMP-binding enzyme family protein [Mycobacteroides abscessus subsp. bolletii 1513]|uniref:AMP-binding enzyme family protein n=1 Tax=Mycobacteroides abscessus subsp. bolletii 1513 TaxID=1299321 RepID=X8DBB4_9MYCO|nr:AMP-binding enzyme family protein [Mycobacteroides abscessus subsp. bolletii 1513]